MPPPSFRPQHTSPLLRCAPPPSVIGPSDGPGSGCALLHWGLAALIVACGVYFQGSLHSPM
eukprot:359137-Chlamydomonas_euryale.AAC.9